MACPTDVSRPFRTADQQSASPHSDLSSPPPACLPSFPPVASQQISGGCNDTHISLEHPLQLLQAQVVAEAAAGHQRLGERRLFIIQRVGVHKLKSQQGVQRLARGLSEVARRQQECGRSWPVAVLGGRWVAAGGAR
eukprot:163668-Chlamydomonas_euryale.AAC.8